MAEPEQDAPAEIYRVQIAQQRHGEADSLELMVRLALFCIERHG